LYASARAQTLHTVVAPALSSGKIVVSDRSFLSSLAYQWEAQWLWFDTVLDVNKSAIQWVLPDIVLYMDIPVDIALARTFDAVWDKWEKMGKDFFEKIVMWYRKSADLDILRWHFEFIDATGTKEDIFQSITECIHSRFQ
jgi:dTMP kinase